MKSANSIIDSIAFYSSSEYTYVWQVLQAIFDLSGI